MLVKIFLLNGFFQHSDNIWVKFRGKAKQQNQFNFSIIHYTTLKIQIYLSLKSWTHNIYWIWINDGRTSCLFKLQQGFQRLFLYSSIFPTLMAPWHHSLTYSTAWYWDRGPLHFTGHPTWAFQEETEEHSVSGVSTCLAPTLEHQGQLGWTSTAAVQEQGPVLHSRQLTNLRAWGKNGHHTSHGLCSVLCTASSKALPLKHGLPWLFLFRSAQNYLGEAGLFLNLEEQTEMKGYFLTWVLVSSGQNTHGYFAWLLWNFLLILLVLHGLTGVSFWKENKKSVTFLTSNLIFIWISLD